MDQSRQSILGVPEWPPAGIVCTGEAYKLYVIGRREYEEPVARRY